MRKLLLGAALAVLCTALPAVAQSTAITTQSNAVTGTLTTSGDTVVASISGVQWGSIKVKSDVAGVNQAAEISVDGGTNWIAAPCGKRVDAVTANPQVLCITANQLPSGSVYEIALPANATSFRMRCTGSSGAVVVTLFGGALYAPGVPVVATLYDVTSATNTALDTATVDTSGWEYVNVSYTTPAGGSGTISMVDDAGTSVTMFTVPASAGAWYPFAQSSPSATAVTALPATGATGALPIQKRMRFQSAGVAAVTSRIRIEARR